MTTPWPIKFNFEPASMDTPAISLKQGDNASYTITVAPDPAYPSTIPPDPITGGAGLLPPQPIITSFHVYRDNSVYDPKITFWTFPTSRSARVDVVTNDLFPFREIRLLLEDGTTRVFTNKAEVDMFTNNTTMKYLVTACIPLNERFVYRRLVAQATSNSTTTPTLTRHFWIRMESDFNATQNLLLELLNGSTPYIDQVAAQNPPTREYNHPNLVTGNKVFAKDVLENNYTAEQSRTVLDERDYNFDSMFKGGNYLEEIATLEETTGMDIIDLIQSSLTNKTEGSSNTNKVPLSDIGLLLPEEDNEICCGCDVPDEPILPPSTLQRKKWESIFVTEMGSKPSIVEYNGRLYIPTTNGNIVVCVEYDMSNLSDYSGLKYLGVNSTYCIIHEHNDKLYMFTPNRIQVLDLTVDISNNFIIDTTSIFGEPYDILTMNDDFYILNSSRQIYKSSDLITWTYISTLELNFHNLIVYNNTMYYTTVNIWDYTNNLHSSTDGVTWNFNGIIPIATFPPNPILGGDFLLYSGFNLSPTTPVLVKVDNSNISEVDISALPYSDSRDSTIFYTSEGDLVAFNSTPDNNVEVIRTNNLIDYVFDEAHTPLEDWSSLHNALYTNTENNNFFTYRFGYNIPFRYRILIERDIVDDDDDNIIPV